MLACVARGVLLADLRHRVWLENIARKKEEEVTYRIPFQVPSIVAGDALSPRLRAATSYAHCAVALAEMCGFSSVSSLLRTRGMARRSSGQPCWEVEKRPRGMIPLEAFQAGKLYPVAFPCWTSLAQVAKESLASGAGVWSILN